jgi:serine/threonine protein kinase
MAESQFGKFTLIRKIASGGMGEVFLARQRGPEGFEKFLVVKRILSHHTDNADYVDMFFAEARLAAKMSHSNIVQIFDMGEIENSYYIAMEYVHGKSIKDIIDASRARKMPIPPAHTADIVGKLCSGMAYAHSLIDESGQSFNIIHRDINPHNVLVNYGGEAKIIDFGIAKSEMNEHKTETGTIKGKFVYMSPEQSAAEKIDKRSDIFSIGIVLYEMLSGENPFQKANIVLSLDAIQRFTPPPPSSINPDFQAFDAIVAKALAKKPDERYQDASEMQLALQRAVILGEIAAPGKNLAGYMQELFKDSIEKEQQYMKDSRREIANTPIADMTPRPRAAPSGPSSRQMERQQPADFTPPPTPLPIHQTGSRSGVTQIRKRRRRTVMSIVASIIVVAGGMVAGILVIVPSSPKNGSVTPVDVSVPTVPTFVEPKASAPAPPTASAVVAPPTATSAPEPSAPAQASAPVQASAPAPDEGSGGREE